MKRKIVKHGNSSLTVSLPFSWVKKLNLKKGDEVDVAEDENRILISAEQRDVLERTQIGIAGLEQHEIMSAISEAYRQGYDEIEVAYDDEADVAVVQSTVNRLLGMVIISHTSRFIHIKDMSHLRPDDFDAVLKRVFFLLLGFCDDFHEALKKRDKEVLQKIYKRDEDINKFCNLGIRVLNKSGYKDFRKIKLFFHLLQQLEHIGDQLVRMDIELINLKFGYSNDLVVMMDHCRKLVREFFELFYAEKKDIKKVKPFYDYYFLYFPDSRQKQCKLMPIFESMIRKKNACDIMCGCYLRDMVLTITNLIDAVVITGRMDEQG